MTSLPSIPLENGLDIRQVLTKGSVLQINLDYEETNCDTENNYRSDLSDEKVEYIGEPIKSLEELRKELKDVDESGFVKKKVLIEGGGDALTDDCTVSVAYSGFWEAENEPFDVRKTGKPLDVDLKENGLLPGLNIAIKSMLVGEMSLFLLSYKVMYGEMGIPPRVKPKADCIFYIKVITSIFTPEEGNLDVSDHKSFQRRHKEVKMLYGAGVASYKVNNYMGAIQSFRKGIFILHNCRLADEAEQNLQEKLLVKLYLNQAICYNRMKEPLKACVSCNELNRLGHLWNNGKALFQNAKALRMIGDFKSAEKRLQKAMNLCPDSDDMKTEYDLLIATKEACDQRKLVRGGTNLELISDSFKQEVDNLVKDFKENVNLCKLTIPSKLNTVEMDYIKEVCIRENLFFNKVQQDYVLDGEENQEITVKVVNTDDESEN